MGVEEKDDFMSMFGSELELNYDPTYEEEDNQDDESSNENIEIPVDEEIQENVDRDEDGEGDESDVDSSPNLYSSISNVLYEQGIIPSLESSENIKTADDFVEVFKKEINIQVESRLQEQLSNLDLEAIAASRQTRFELDSIDEDYLKDNIEVAKKLIYQDYINQGLSTERATRMLRKASDLGEDILIEDALESINSLKEFEKRVEENEIASYKENMAKQEKEQEVINTRIKDLIYNSKEVIAGIPNTKALQDKVFKSMTEPVSKNAQTGEMQNKFMETRSANPLEFDAKMYYLFELTKGFTDLSLITNKATSKSVKTLENVLRKTKFNEDSGLPGFMEDRDSYSGTGFGSELVL